MQGFGKRFDLGIYVSILSGVAYYLFIYLHVVYNYFFNLFTSTQV